MQNDDYKAELEKLSLKIDKNCFLLDEILPTDQHNMLVEGQDCQENFRKTFDAVKDDYFALEKVDMIDYWNMENERRY
ncbi:MAG: hypothetical protein IJY90_00070 [Clostridia bacterium]|nr:hypothetical protein [Clostridia bacterium]